MGLGPINLLSLAEARIKALECRKQLLEGLDPLEVRNSSRAEKALIAARAMTFEDCAAAYIASHRSGWKNAKHADQWVNTIATYANPFIGLLPINSIDTALVTKVLEPIWYVKTETASRLRNRIELILAWATVRGYRSGANPALWKGHLDQLLPKKSNVQKTKHFAALPFAEVADFISNLRVETGAAALGLEFQILTATRTGEVIGALWNEISLDEATWTIPAHRMKAKREHRVPLSPRALEILCEARNLSDGTYIFGGRTKNRPLSNNTFLALLKKRMKVDVTAHGFRSTFRDWASERTNYPREVVEMALAHTIKDATEAAYRRGDLLFKRQALMREWATYCYTRQRSSNVVQSIHSQVGSGRTFEA